MGKDEFKRSVQNKVKTKWHDKRMYGKFDREMNEYIDKGLSWKWVVESDLKVQTEALIFAAQGEQLLMCS